MERSVRPILLAGGQGTRMQSANHALPKQLVKIHKKPLLWYAIKNTSMPYLRNPIVTLAYKSSNIRNYFNNEGIDFRDLPGRTMVESFLEVAESDDSDAFLGVSGDLLFTPKVLTTTLDLFHNTGQDSALFIRSTTAGHNSWESIVEGDKLIDIVNRDANTTFVGLVIIIRSGTIKRIRNQLGKPITFKSLPKTLQRYHSGWLVILKSLLLMGNPVMARNVDLPMINVNTMNDVASARCFVTKHLPNLSRETKG